MVNPPGVSTFYVRQVPFREPPRFASFDLSRPHSPVSPGFASFWAEDLLDQKIGGSALRPGGGWGVIIPTARTVRGLKVIPGLISGVLPRPRPLFLTRWSVSIWPEGHDHKVQRPSLSVWHRSGRVFTKKQKRPGGCSALARTTARADENVSPVIFGI